MVNINLLPWRRYEKMHQRKIFLKYLLLMMGIILIFILLQMILNHHISKEQHIILNLQKQMRAANIQQEYITNRQQPLVQLFHRFQHNQTQLLGFFEQVLQQAPENIVWQSILSQNQQIILTGETSSLPILLEWVKSFNDIKTLFHAEIIKIKSVKQSDRFQFSMQFFQILLPLEGIK
jgi:Tfp pilus assembly protein PilN